MNNIFISHTFMTMYELQSFDIVSQKKSKQESTASANYKFSLSLSFYVQE